MHDRPLYEGRSTMVDSHSDTVGTSPPPVRVVWCMTGPFWEAIGKESSGTATPPPHNDLGKSGDVSVRNSVFPLGFPYRRIRILAWDGSNDLTPPAIEKSQKFGPWSELSISIVSLMQVAR